MDPMKALGHFQAMVDAYDANGEDSAYQELEASMLVFKVADDAIHRGARSPQSVEFARKHIARLENLDARRQLMGMLADTDPDTIAFPDRLYAEFLAYGITKRALGQYGAAIVAFRLVTTAHCQDVDLRMKAHYHLAWALRLNRQFPEAIDAYTTLSIMASHLNEPRMVVEGRLGLAKVAIDQMDLERADVLLADVIRMANDANQPPVAAKAYIDRARVAGIQGRHVDAIRYAHVALRDLDSSVSYERALANIAYGLREVGRLESSAELAHWLSNRTRDKVQQAELYILLYHLAIDSHDWPGADQYRHGIANVLITPDVEAQYRLAVTRHDAGLGEWRTAAAQANLMHEIAATNHLPEATASALRAMLMIQERRVPEIYEEHESARTPAEIERAILPIEMDLLDIRQRDLQSA